MIIGLITDTATKLFVWGLVWHLFADWILQNAWMSDNKSNLLHPAAYVHSGLHLLGLLLIFPPLVALGIAMIHLGIDTRLPLSWWRRVYRQTREGDVALHVAIWSDQTCHVLVLAIAAFIIGRHS